MNLILKYDCQYGYRNLYMTETDCELDVGRALLEIDLMSIQNLKDFVEDGMYESEEEALKCNQQELWVDQLVDLYNEYKLNPMRLFEESANPHDGLLSCELEFLEECVLEDAFHDYFKQCFPDTFPGYFQMYNCRLELVEDSEPLIEYSDEVIITADTLRTCTLDEVNTLGRSVVEKEPIEYDSATTCSLLGISRQTLSNWVKAGKLSRTENGKYLAEEVKALKLVKSRSELLNTELYNILK